jgi:hypothetical protein
MQKVNEGLSRQNVKYMELYREFLKMMQNELKEKKFFLEQHPTFLTQEVAG